MKELPKDYLQRLAKRQKAKAVASLKGDEVGQVLMYSGTLLDWVGEWVSDTSVSWQKRKIKIDDLTLTGTSPKWNKIILEKAERNPLNLRQLFEDKKILQIFEKCRYDKMPILVRKEIVDGKTYLKVLDGMTRVIGAIKTGKKEIEAYIGERKVKPKAEIEAHVIYDLLKAYKQNRGKKKDLLGAIRFLRETYGNVDSLLKNRFNQEWGEENYLQQK